jgi:hypothetical protein
VPRDDGAPERLEPALEFASGKMIAISADDDMNLGTLRAAGNPCQEVGDVVFGLCLTMEVKEPRAVDDDAGGVAEDVGLDGGDGHVQSVHAYTLCARGDPGD